MQKRAVAILAAFLLALGAAVGGVALGRELFAKPMSDAAEYREYRAAVELRDAELAKMLRELSARADVVDASKDLKLDAKVVSLVAAKAAEELERPIISERRHTPPPQE